MKSHITREDWLILEPIFAKAQIGYQVKFDDHNGYVEMIVVPNTISVMRDDIVNEEEDFSGEDVAAQG